MKKILITYSSKTGNTKKLCSEAINRLSEDIVVDFKTMKETDTIDGYDLVVPAFWVDKGTANREAKKFIAKIKDKNVLLLATLGAAPDSEHGIKVTNNAPNLVDDSNKYFGIFLARGKVDEKLTNRIKFLPLSSSIKEQMYEASISSREPNEEEFKGAAKAITEALHTLEI